MASVSYPVSTITAGVSTQEYSLRMDGQASEQKNVLNDPRYGLCKRPGTKFLKKVSSGQIWNAPMMFPLVYGASEKLYVYGATAPSVVSCFDGSSTVMSVFPSSTSAATSSYAYYGMVSAAYPNQASHVRVGDVTFIANHTRQPAMKSTTWQGYTSTSDKIRQGDDAGFLSVGAVKNDDVWAAWVQKIDPNVMAEYKITWSEEIPGTDSGDAVVTEYADVVTRYKDKSVYNEAFTAIAGYSDTEALEDSSAANAHHLCAKMAYRVTATENAASDHMMQATSLSNCSYASSSADLISGTELTKGEASVLGRYVNQEGNAPGKLLSVTASSSVANKDAKKNWKAGSDQVDFFGMAWKTVDSLAALPPISWKDHTLKVVDDDSNPYGFYMRYVPDDVTPATFSHTSSAGAWAEGDTYPVFTPTTSLSRAGHWEEHCGVGVATEIDSATMPHMVVRRPDGSFVFMEARGSFEVNTGNGANNGFAADWLQFDKENTSADTEIRFYKDNGFIGDVFVRDDTIEFTERDLDGNAGSAEYLPSELSFNTEYYIKSYREDSGSVFIEISATKGGPAISFTVAAPILTQGFVNAGLNITTYKKLKYASRQAGDDTTNPLPDFFTNKIKGLASYQDRLVIHTENELVLSGVSDAFNFFRLTVRDLLDSDPIKVRPSQADNESIVQLAAYNTGLVAVTNRKQLLIYGDSGALTHSTLTVIEAGSTETDIYTKPLVVDNSLYCAYSSTFGGGLYEFYPESTSSFSVRDVTQQVPSFLPQGPRAIQASSKHKMFFWLDDAIGAGSTYRDSHTLYVYTWDVGGPEKRQSAWTSWNFLEQNEVDAQQIDEELSTTDFKIENIVCLSDRLYMLVRNGSGDGANPITYSIYYIDLDINVVETNLGEPYQSSYGTILLDQLIRDDQFTNMTFLDFDPNQPFATRITLPYPGPQLAKRKYACVVIAVKETFINPEVNWDTYKETFVIPYGDPTNPNLTLTQTGSTTAIDVFGYNFTEGIWNVWVGFSYTMSHTLGPFSPVIGDRHVRGRNVFVRGARLTYSKLPSLAIETSKEAVDIPARVQNIYPNDAKSAQSGEEFFAVQQPLPDLEVSLINDTPWQSMMQGLTYDLNIQEGMNQAVWR